MTPDAAVTYDDLVDDHRCTHRVDHDTAALIDELFDAFAPNNEHEFDRDVALAELDRVLTASLLRRDGGANGTELNDTAAAALNTEFSPGTTYPRLHGLRDRGVLEEIPLGRTHQYRVADIDAANAMLRAGMVQHAVLAAVYREALRR